MFKTGFIGCGNMGGVLCSCAAKSMGGDNILASDRSIEKINELSDDYGVIKATNEEIAKECKYIFLGVKPQVFFDVLDSITPILNDRTDRFILVSMAAGIDIWSIKRAAGEDVSVVRIMPNTPCKVGSGVVLISNDDTVSVSETDEIENILSECGLTDISPEGLIDAAGCVSGCGPAFVYMFTEALADGGVHCGLPRDKALKYAAQTICGSAQMVLSSGKHPGELKDAVCSPGGTTIEGVRALEKGRFRSSAMSAVVKSYEKTLSLLKGM